MSKPLVSVVIPTFNAAETIAESLASVRAQTYDNYEIIVVDDASTDGTVAAIRSELTNEQINELTNPHIHVFPENRGACAARNEGVRLAQGDYIAFLDADDVWELEKLAKQVDILEQYSDFGAVHCGTSRMDETGTPLADARSAPKQRVNGNVFLEFFEANISVILTSTVCIRKSCFDEIGMFDGSGAVVDDHDFFLRLAARYPIWYIHEPLVRYRVVSGSLSRARAVRRVEQHKQTIERALAANPDVFSDLPPGYLKKRWRSFARWAGMMLYYRGEYRAARGYLKKILVSSPIAIPYYLLSFLRRSPADDQLSGSAGTSGKM